MGLTEIAVSGLEFGFRRLNDSFGKYVWILFCVWTFSVDSFLHLEQSGRFTLAMPLAVPQQVDNRFF